MRLRHLRVDGFGKLVDRTFDFGPGFNVVYGSNEAGKSTLGRALLASLFGVERGDKERYRPWSGARYGTTLGYELADGRTFEVRRDYERDGKGIRVFDRNGRDASGETSIDKTIDPGRVHLGVSLDVFVNASFAAQGGTTIDGRRADRIAQTLARALDGGPKDNAALEALRALDDALAKHVGKKRATVNAPLRRLGEEIAEAAKRVDAMRTERRALDESRARLAAQRERTDELESALRDSDRRVRALRARVLRARLTTLADVRKEFADLRERLAGYVDVADFPSDEARDLDGRYRTWHTLEALAGSHADEAASARLSSELLAELRACTDPAGSIDDRAMAELERAESAARAAERDADAAEKRARHARDGSAAGRELFGAAFASGGFVMLGAVVLAAARDWLPAALVACVAGVLFRFAWSRSRARADRSRALAALERAADDADARARDASSRVAAALDALGVASLDDVRVRRARGRELRDRLDRAERLAERARTASQACAIAAEAFDGAIRRLVAPSGSRERDLANVRALEARASAREGVERRLSMLAMRRTDVLASDDETALASELDELLASGVEPAREDASPKALDAERAALERQAAASRTACAEIAAGLRAAEGRIGDLAAADERLHALRARASRLERFESDVSRARRAIDERTKDAHQTFARRLADYASDTFERVTDGRYTDLRVDPVTLDVNVRVPETGAIENVDRLSAGTREQAHLVVRLAMSRMFSEGLETAPVLLDDPFAFWDDERIARGVPILLVAAREAQVVLFTTSAPLRAAASGHGATVIDLPGPSIVLAS